MVSKHRRSPIEIRVSILRAVRDKGYDTQSGLVGPTQIMYSANLSWLLLKAYVEELLKRGLIIHTTIGERDAYQCTSAGLDIVHRWEELERLVSTTAIPIKEAEVVDG